MPGLPLEGRISKQWSEIGFQGNDPATDFRGMGILGLKCLLYPCNRSVLAVEAVPLGLCPLIAQSLYL